MKNKTTILLDILESAIANVQLNEEVINKLNVFPVPDGDTGSNMLSTLLTGWNSIDHSEQDLIQVVKTFAKGALFGARGNSGVITSQIIKGFANGVEKVGGISSNTETLKIIFRNIRECAYASVLKPVEGTILSIVRAWDEKYNRDSKDLIEAFGNIWEISKEATDYTPEQLPILKESGVVDSGAYGITLLVEGVLEALKGNPFKLKTTSQGTTSNKEHEFKKASAFKNIGYCSEFIMTIREPKSFDDEGFKTELNAIGDSLVYIREEDIIKVHLHVLNPGNLFNLAQKHGEFSKIKVDNMTTQVDENHTLTGETVSDSFGEHNKIDPSKLAIIGVSNGVGLDKEFTSLGVDKLVSGGQSMNPSVEDFIEHINKLPNKEIILLPNNSNIVLTCQTVQKLVTNKKIHVIETKSLQQGIVALYNINKEMKDFENYIDGVKEAIKHLKEGTVTKAVRNTKMNGVDVTEGDYISISAKEIIASKPSKYDASVALIDKLLAGGGDFITIYYNDQDDPTVKEKLVEYIESKYSDFEVKMLYGGQAVYNFLMFVE